MKKELILYELILLFNFTLTEQELSEKLDLYRNFLTERGSQVLVKIHGTRSLAYPIKGFDTANYVQIIYLGNGALNQQINTELQRDESILRTVTTKLLGQNVSDIFAFAV